MVGRPLRSLFAAFGMELLPRDALERERQASARTTQALEESLRLAREEHAWLQAELARLRTSGEQTATELWAKVGKERTRAEAAESEARRSASSLQAMAAELWGKVGKETRRAEAAEAAAAGARRAAAAAEETVAELWALVAKERKRAEAATRAASTAGPSEAFDSGGQVQELRARLKSEGERKAEIKARLKEQTAIADALEAENRRRQAELLDVEERLAELASGSTRDVADDLLAALGAFPGRRSDLASDRAVETLLKRSGLKTRGGDDAAAYFRLGRGLQVQGASELAAAAYRKVGPAISEFLAQPGPDGRPVSGPDFLIIGAPRAGTTWLKRALSHHPDVMMFAGEPQFFAMTSYLGPDEYVGRFARAGARFLRRDRKERTPDRPTRPIIGEKSTTYLSMSEAQISLCAALYPKARIICLIRDPVARAWSHIKHDGLAHYGAHPQKLYEQPYWQSMDAYVRHGRYERHLMRWARRYPPEQIHLVDFSRLASDGDALYREVLDHLGAAHSADLQVPERVNQSIDSAPPERLKAILERAYANERFDIPHLKAAMEQAHDNGIRHRRLPPKPGQDQIARPARVAAQ